MCDDGHGLQIDPRREKEQGVIVAPFVVATSTPTAVSGGAGARLVLVAGALLCLYWLFRDLSCV